MSEDPIWISKAPAYEHTPEGPLAGLKFAIKDNIDLAQVPTSAGCPAFAYTPERSATVVQKLMDAGAIPLGKTNMDQFATGLVGTRSPYGACSSVFDQRYISGGSSSGSAVAVAQGLVDFSLGTDTAGSGRVPAAFNGIVGVKPTRGLLSTRGVVPACRSLDCVSIFARDCYTAAKVLESARGFDPADPFSRAPRIGEDANPWVSGKFRFGVPAKEHLEFFGDEEAAELYQKALVRMAEYTGAEQVEIDFSVFREAAALLYSGPWVAERLSALRRFMDAHAAEMNPVVRQIIEGARKYTAVDAFEADYKLRELKRAAEAEWRKMEVMLLPTTGTIYTHEQIAAEPIKLNTNLGYYTNFVNLMDLAAIAMPAGVRANGLPFGVQFIGPAFSDEALLQIADLYHREGHPVSTSSGCMEVAVVGAHLTGQPLNYQLTDRSARLLRTARTAPQYRLYALKEGKIAKPGLLRDELFTGPGIEVEVWAIPEDKFGGFVALIPAPLGIGTVTLEGLYQVKCFICEPYALANADEITHFGGWRNYLAGRTG